MPDQIPCLLAEYPAASRIFYGRPMSSSPHIFDVNLEDFDAKVIAASRQRPILVDLWADWCPPCLALAPVLDKVIAHHGGAVALAKVEVDEGDNMKLAGRHQVRGFPTILLFQDGEVQGRFSSAQSFQFVLDFIGKHARL
jgi:thioredoxin 1